MMKLKKYLFLLTFLFSASFIQAQVQRCHTDEVFEEMKKAEPALELNVRQAREMTTEYLTQQSSLKSGERTIITIPIVVHVMHNGEAIGTGPNISEAQILSQIEVLNQDYMGLNTDISSVPSHFSNVLGNPQIEFCLAQFDPEGNPTNGINRVSMGGSGFWTDSRKPGTIWNRSNYLNMWVAPIQGGTLGYATFPGSSANSDGVVIDYRYFGKKPHNSHNSKFDLGRTATHEVGHWLGLEHTFQGGCSGTNANNCSTAGDRICDTPPTSSANYGCSLTINRNTCTETPVDQFDMWMNYMDYMDDACLFMFTKGQVDVMLGVLSTSRASILSSPACEAVNLFSYSGKVVDAKTNEGVPNARVLFQGVVAHEITTDGIGNFTSMNFREGTYSIYAGKWGYMTTEFSASAFIDETTGGYTIPIEPGYYYDDFIMDFGWTVSGNATTGMWERGIPIGTVYNGLPCNPGADMPGDFGSACYITGNGGGSAGNDDVDDGEVILYSPLFDLTTYNEPYISYFRWFCNDGGQGNPDDELIITLSNGTEIVDLEVIDANAPDNQQWVFKNIRVKEFITPSATMQFIAKTSDLPGTGHLVEAALDVFSVIDSLPNPVGIPTIPEQAEFSIYPNPASSLLYLDVRVADELSGQIFITDLSGKQLHHLTVEKNEVIQLDVSKYSAGVYFVKLLTRSGTKTKKFITLQQ